MLSELAAFSLAALVLTVSPGADMALVARRALVDGRGVAARTSFGVCSGLIVHATASAVGVSAVLARSATAFTVLKLCGAGHLFLLGVTSLRVRAVRPTRTRGTPAPAARTCRAFSPTS